MGVQGHAGNWVTAEAHVGREATVDVADVLAQQVVVGHVEGHGDTAHTHTHTHTHTHMNTRATHTQTCEHTKRRTQTHKHTLIRYIIMNAHLTLTHAHTQACTHTHRPAYTNTHTHAHARAHTHTYILAHTNTDTNTRYQKVPKERTTLLR